MCSKEIQEISEKPEEYRNYKHLRIRSLPISQLVSIQHRFLASQCLAVVFRQSGLCSEHNGRQILNHWTTREIQARALEFKSWFQLISWGKLFNFFEPQFPHL